MVGSRPIEHPRRADGGHGQGRCAQRQAEAPRDPAAPAPQRADVRLDVGGSEQGEDDDPDGHRGGECALLGVDAETVSGSRSFAVSNDDLSGQLTGEQVGVHRRGHRRRRTRHERYLMAPNRLTEHDQRQLRRRAFGSGHRNGSGHVDLDVVDRRRIDPGHGDHARFQIAPSRRRAETDQRHCDRRQSEHRGHDEGHSRRTEVDDLLDWRQVLAADVGELGRAVAVVAVPDGYVSSSGRAILGWSARFESGCARSAERADDRCQSPRQRSCRRR